MATGVVGAQLPHRAALPQLPRREIRKAGKLKQSNLVSQLSVQLEQQRLKLQLSVQREAAIVSACNAACAVCLRFGASHEFTTTLVGAVSLALHNLAAAEAYVILPCPTSTNSQHPVEQLASSGEEATDTDKDEVGTEQASTGPVAFDIFEADDSMWTAPSVSHAATGSRDLKESPRCGVAQQLDSGDAAAGASAEDRANRASSQPDTDTSSLGHLPQPSSCTRQALEDAYSEHRVASFKDLNGNTSPECFDAIAHTCSTSKEDFSSHDLAEQCGSLPTCTSPVFVDAIAPTCNASKEDFNSRDLEEQCGPLPNNTSPECFDAIAHTCSTSMEDFSSQDLAAQCGSLPTCTSSVIVDAIAPTCNANKEDFNSQDLAEQCGPLPYSPPHVLFDASTHICSETSGDFNSRDLAGQCGPLPNSPPKVLFDASAHTFSANSEDFNSQDLAVQCGPLPNSPSVLHGANAQIRSASNKDCKSQHFVEQTRDGLSVPRGTMSNLGASLADVPRGSMSNLGASLAQNFVEQSLPTLATRSAHQEDFNSQDLAEQCGPVPNSPPKVLFDASAHTCSAISEDFSSQELAVQCGPLPNSPSVLFGANAHTCSANKEDINLYGSAKSPWQEIEVTAAKLASNLASFFGTKVQQSTRQELETHDHVSSSQSLATEDLSLTLGPSERESNRPSSKTLQSKDAEDFTPTGAARPVLPQDFIDVASSIIGVYCKRRKPTRKHIMSAAAALIRAAKKHGVTYDDCKHYVEGQSLALVCDISDHWCTT